MLVRHVRHGKLYVVSDSDVHIAMYYKGQSATLLSANADLWKELFELVPEHELGLKLFWVSPRL